MNKLEMEKLSEIMQRRDVDSFAPPDQYDGSCPKVMKNGQSPE